jgi:hypothetical protein
VKNPGCEANVISAVAGVPMNDVALAEGLDPTMGQSPFALARGQAFERRVFDEGAARLIEALIKEGVLPAGASGLLDLRLTQTGGKLRSRAAAVERTTKLLQEAAAAGPAGLARKLPCVVAGATLEIPGQPVMLPDGRVSIDALVLRPAPEGERIELVIGEIKSYPDRGGYTEAADLATTRAQAGVYLHALRLVIDDLGLEDALTTSKLGFIVLTRAGTNEPSVRAKEDLEFQARRAERGFRRMRAAAEAIQPFDPEDQQAGIAHVVAATTDFHPDCLSFCDRAAGCRARAEADGRPSVLGDDVADFLGAVPLPRAIALLEGDRPANDTEEDLVHRMHVSSSGAGA